MQSLSETWFIEGNIDFESKKYTLLAYLQRINKHFSKHELYPQLSDVLFHLRNLQSFRNNKAILRSQFPKKITGIDMERIRLIYEEMVADDALMEEVEEIVHYAIGLMDSTISNGTDLHDFVEENMTISPVGIMPFDNQEGYFFLSNGAAKQIRVYSYRLTIFERADDQFRALRAEFVQSWRRNFVNTYESIKAELLRTRRTLLLPAVYAIETNLNYPVEETLLPVAKRRFVRYIS